MNRSRSARVVEEAVVPQRHRSAPPRRLPEFVVRVGIACLLASGQWTSAALAGGVPADSPASFYDARQQIQGFLARAQAALDAGNGAVAVWACEQVLNLDPGNAQARALLYHLARQTAAPMPTGDLSSAPPAMVALPPPISSTTTDLRWGMASVEMPPATRQATAAFAPRVAREVEPVAATNPQLFVTPTVYALRRRDDDRATGESSSWRDRPSPSRFASDASASWRARERSRAQPSRLAGVGAPSMATWNDPSVWASTTAADRATLTQFDQEVAAFRQQLDDERAQSVLAQRRLDETEQRIERERARRQASLREQHAQQARLMHDELAQARAQFERALVAKRQERLAAITQQQDTEVQKRLDAALRDDKRRGEDLTKELERRKQALLAQLQQLGAAPDANARINATIEQERNRRLAALAVRRASLEKQLRAKLPNEQARLMSQWEAQQARDIEARLNAKASTLRAAQETFVRQTDDAEAAKRRSEDDLLSQYRAQAAQAAQRLSEVQSRWQAAQQARVRLAQRVAETEAQARREREAVEARAREEAERQRAAERAERERQQAEERRHTEEARLAREREEAAERRRVQQERAEQERQRRAAEQQARTQAERERALVREAQAAREKQIAEYIAQAQTAAAIGHYEAALQRVQSALMVDPSSHVALATVEHIRRQQQQDVEAQAQRERDAAEARARAATAQRVAQERAERERQHLAAEQQRVAEREAQAARQQHVLQYLAQAQAAAALSRYDEALQDVQAALAIEATSHDALAALERIHRQQQMESEAAARRQQEETQARERAERERQTAELQRQFDALIADGQALFERGEYASAIPVFQEASTWSVANPSVAVAWLQRARAKQEAIAQASARRAERTRQAELAMEHEVQREQQRQLAALYDGAQRMLRERRFVDTINALQRILALDPDHAAAKAALARAEQLKKEADEEEHFKEIAALFLQGKRAYAEGDYTTSARLMEKVIQMEGNPRRKYTPEAQALLEASKAKMASPQPPTPPAAKTEDEAPEAKADAQKQRAMDAARKTAEQIAKQQTAAQRKMQAMQARLTEQQLKLLLAQGKDYFRSGQYTPAIITLQQMEQIDPQHPLTMEARSYTTLAQARLAAAQAMASSHPVVVETSRAASGTVPDIESQLLALKEEVASLLRQGREHYRQGRYETAVAFADRVLAKDASNREAQQLMRDANDAMIQQEEERVRQSVQLDEQRMLLDVARQQTLPPTKYAPGGSDRRESRAAVSPIRRKLSTPVTVDFRDVDLGYVLNFLSQSTDVNIVPTRGVSLEDKRVSIRIKDMPLESALRYILKNQGLDYRLDEDAILVTGPGAEAEEELETRVFFLNRGLGLYTNAAPTPTGTTTQVGGGGAASAFTTIKDVLEQAVSHPRDSKMVLDERTGALIVTNTPSNLKLIEQILDNLDASPVQVLIEARFVEVSVTDLAEIGLESKLTGSLPITKEMRGGTKTAHTQIGTTSGTDFAAFTRGAEGLNLTLQGVLTDPQFQTVLHLLEESKKSKTLSAPRVTTLNNQTAMIKDVEEFIFPTRFEVTLIQFDKNGDGDFDDAGETEFANVPQDFVTRDVGIVLNVTPSVGGDNRSISLTLMPEVSEGVPDFFSFSSSTKLPKFTTRTVNTSVVINDGETVVLGGLIKETDSKKTTKVPVLGDAPVVGGLFRRKSDETVRSNLLIFVTARLLTPAGELIRR